MLYNDTKRYKTIHTRTPTMLGRSTSGLADKAGIFSTKSEAAGRGGGEKKERESIMGVH